MATKSKQSTESDSNKNTSTTISNATSVSLANGGNIVAKGKHRLSEDVNLF